MKKRESGYIPPHMKEPLEKQFTYYLEEAGMTQRQAARLCGITPKTAVEWVKKLKIIRIGKMQLQKSRKHHRPV